MLVSHGMRIDLTGCGCQPVAHAVQGEANTRQLVISLFTNSVAWEIPSGATAAVAFLKPDGKKGLYDKLPDGSPATVLSGNTVAAILAPQALTCAGTVLTSIVFYDAEGDTLATFPFRLLVERNPAAGEQISNDYYNPSIFDLDRAVRDLEEQVEELKKNGPSGGNGSDSGQNLELDSSLTQSGKAADAKTTGDEIKRVEGKIPSIEGLAKTEDIPTKPEDIGAQPQGNYALASAVPTKVSQLQNDAKYLAAITAAMVTAALGYTPISPGVATLGMHTDGLLYLFVGGSPVGNGVELPSGGISGYVDSDNNIIINGLSDGSYTVRYEMEDGGTIDIGALEVGEAEPEEHNYFDASTALLNHRLGSSGSPSAYNGMVTTDFIPWDEAMRGKNFYVSGATQVLNTAYGYFGRIVYYDANKTMVTSYNDGDGTVDAWIVTTMAEYTGGGFVRISLVLKDNAALTAADVATLKIALE